MSSEGERSKAIKIVNEGQDIASGIPSSKKQSLISGGLAFDNQIQQVSVFQDEFKASQPQIVKPKKVVYTAKKLNFKHGYLDMRGMEQKLQRFAYKHPDCDTYFDSDPTS